MYLCIKYSMKELELFELITSHFTRLFLLMDDSIEDDKMGETEPLIAFEKERIVSLVNLAGQFGVNVHKNKTLDDVIKNQSFKDWCDDCKTRLKQIKSSRDEDAALFEEAKSHLKGYDYERRIFEEMYGQEK